METNERADSTVKENRQRGQLPWKIACIVLAAAIVGVFCFAVLPKLRGTPVRGAGTLEQIDFSSSWWLDEYIEKTAGAYGLDFVESSAFSYGQGTGKIAFTYASEQSVEELRAQYQEQLGAVEYGRNDETALHLSAELAAGALDVTNTFSQVCRVVNLELTLSQAEYDQIIGQMDAAFPDAELDAIPALAQLRASERYGSYVRYIYDEMNEYLYKDRPVFSCAYRGTAQEYEALVEELTQAYENNAYDSAGDVRYFEAEGNILGISAVQTASGEDLVSLLFQFGA